jgi:plastocyanin
MVGEVLVRDEDGNVPERAAASPVADDAVPVQIANLAFDPATVTVATGETVTWSNDDSVPHTVTAEDGSFDSRILDPGGRFSWTFDQPGTVAYQCALHPDMRGEVEVSGDGPVQQFDGGATGTPSAASGSATPAGSGSAADAEVTIIDLAYEPPVVTVPAGSEVTWTNEGQLPHTVTSDGFDSGVLQPGQTFRRVFADPGTFDYACAIHPGMTGQVVVE